MKPKGFCSIQCPEPSAQPSPAPLPCTGGQPSFQSPVLDSVETPSRNKQVYVHSFCKNMLPQLPPPPHHPTEVREVSMSDTEWFSLHLVPGSGWILLVCRWTFGCCRDPRAPARFPTRLYGNPHPHLRRPAARSHWRLGATLPDDSQAHLQPQLPSRYSRPQAPSPCASGTGEGVCHPGIWVALEVKNPPAGAGDIRDTSSIPGSGRSLGGGGHGNPFQSSCLENPMDGGPGGLQSMGHTELDTTEAT